MRRALATLAVAAAATVPSGQANATPPSIFGTTCGLVAFHETTGLLMQPDEFNGVLVGPALGVDLAELDDNLVSVTIHCRLMVNGIMRDSASGVFAPAAVALNVDVDFLLTDGSTAVLCTDIIATDTSFETRSRTTCKEASVADVPPDEICELVVVREICALPTSPPETLLPVRVAYVVPDPVLGA